MLFNNASDEICPNLSIMENPITEEEEPKAFNKEDRLKRKKKHYYLNKNNHPTKK